MKARHMDLWISKIGSIAFAVVFFVLNGALKWGFATKDILLIASFIFLVGLPVSVSFWIQGIEAVVKAKTGVQLPPVQMETVTVTAPAVSNPTAGQVG